MIEAMVVTITKITIRCTEVRVTVVLTRTVCVVRQASVSRTCDWSQQPVLLPSGSIVRDYKKL